MDTLIRLKYVDRYHPESLEKLTEKKNYISRLDRSLYIDRDSAYKEINSLMKEISVRLWHDDAEKAKHLFYTEMLLFSIADREVFMDITRHFSSMAGTLYDVPRPRTESSLPASVKGRNIFSRIVPTVCNLEPMLHNLREQDWNWSMLRDWERAQYRAYRMDDIVTKLKQTPEVQWKDIIKQHLLECEVHELGPHPMDIYLLAYYAKSNRKRNRKDFIAFVKESGISEKDLSGSAIWQVGLKEDGWVLDWDFVNRLCGNGD
ncbi:hypothetical protein [Sphingobacterium luzhongxinii]|uniref:hypothetical protein n=1 Tax=Sphingobacterium luzhongxinii TaxID=2654181 RepID=UPI0013DA848B|nr:hypothetical protein [Sphingobacterium sp. xlx-73]